MFKSLSSELQYSSCRPERTSHMGVPQDSVCYAAQKTVLILLILPSCGDTTMSITYYLDYEPFATSLDFPLPTT